MIVEITVLIIVVGLLLWRLMALFMEVHRECHRERMERVEMHRALYSILLARVKLLRIELESQRYE
jgi:hypothetical protein